MVAAANMYYYWTIVCDLPSEDVVVLKSQSVEQQREENNERPLKVNGHLQPQEKQDIVNKPKHE